MAGGGLAEKGAWALGVMVLGALLQLVRGIFNRRAQAGAAAKIDAATTAAAAAQKETVGAKVQAQEEQADAKLAQETAAVGGMDDAAVLADAHARLERERAAAPERHRD